VDVTANLEAPCPPEVLAAWVEDLGRYPSWLDIVPRAVPAPAWEVDLRGRLGPLARSKRLRMVRSALDPGASVRFERLQRDGRRHSPWVLEATVAAGPTGSRLTMHLHYGGSLGGPALERLLGDAIERSRPRLLECVAGGPPPGGAPGHDG
jgi:hypothetical protein